MEYNYRVVNLTDKKILVLDFKDKKYEGIADLLDVYGMAITVEDILMKIDLVLSGESDHEAIGTERTMAEIGKNETEIWDGFEDIVSESEVHPTIYLPTRELRKIVSDFIEKQKEFDLENK